MTDTLDLDRLLALWWPEAAAAAETFRTSAGEQVRIFSAGERVVGRNLYAGAEVEIDGRRFMGEVVVGSERSEGAVLGVTAGEATPVFGLGGRVVPRITVEVPAAAERRLAVLKEGAEFYGCAGVIGAMSSLHRAGLMTSLLVERLQRKYNDLKTIHSLSGGNWEQTMYAMLFKTMGDNRNREAFVKLARSVPYVALLHERRSLLAVEAMLLGGSGLLECYECDDYVTKLKSEFEYFRRKYRIAPLKPSEWNVSRINPMNHPVLRMVQIAAFLTREDFVFSRLVACRTGEELYRLFDAEASDYWTTHYIPGRSSAPCSKRIGRSKCDLLGINVVTPLKFAYANFTGNDAMREEALELLEDIAPESNLYTRRWMEGGVELRSAFDSQAVLQLSNEYCMRGRCTECLIGRNALRSAMKGEGK